MHDIKLIRRLKERKNVAERLVFDSRLDFFKVFASVADLKGSN
jgi:hypothetical protein